MVSPQREPQLNRLAGVGLGVAVLLLGASLLTSDISEVSVDVAYPVVLLTMAAVAASGLGWRRSDRTVWEPSAPIMFAAGVLAGPAAPLVLVAQAQLVALASIRRQEWRLVTLNAGVLSVRWFLIGVALRAIPMEFEGWLAWIHVALVAGVISSVGLTVNYLGAAAAIRSIYGKWPHPRETATAAWKDILGSAALGLIAWASPSAGWVAVPLVVIFTAFGYFEYRAYRRRCAVARVEFQSHIVNRERSGPNPGHTERVVAIVDAGSKDFSPAVRKRLLRAAWFHSLTLGGLPHRCSGVSYPAEFHRIVGSVPCAARGGKDLWVKEGIVNDHTPPAAELLAAACAWDARHLDGAPVNSLDDLVFTFGVHRPVANAVATASRIIERSSGGSAAPR